LNVTRVTLALALLVPTVHADVLLVSAAGEPGAFVNLAAAVTAAVDGDIILVKQGTGGPAVTVSGKAITIAGFDPANPPFLAKLILEGVPAGKTLVVSDVVLSTTSGGVIVRDNAGTVWAHGCNWNTGTGGTGLVVENTNLLVLSGSIVRGGYAAGLGLQVEASNVALFDTVVRGGDGAVGFSIGLDGGTAAAVLTGTLRTMGGEIRGGDGGYTDDKSHCGFPGDGGTGLIVSAGAFAARGPDTELVGGLQGFAFSGCSGGNPQAGLPSVGDVADLEFRSQFAALPGVLREGEAASLALSGTPGAGPIVLIALDAQLGPIKPAQMPVLVSLAAPVLVFLPPLGPDGTDNIHFLTPNLPAGVENLRFFVQGVFLIGGAKAFGGGAATSIVDSAF
jgi:hypothetical protein